MLAYAGIFVLSGLGICLSLIRIMMRMNVNFELVTAQSQLEAICQQSRKAGLIMLDTEFVRTRTLYPRLGLIQLYFGEMVYLLDPLYLDDLSPLWDLLTDQGVLKVLHACSEDLEVFYHASGVMPSPIVDTQIMAAFLGHGLSTGFAALVNEYLEVSLDKGEARTDWCARPLTDKQLTYAAADVYYLYPLYKRLKEEIKVAGWQAALEEECLLLLAKRSKRPDPDSMYLEVNNAWQLDQKQLAVLKKLAAWRLKEAQRRDLALNFVVKDLHLWKMARFNIRSLDKMEKEGFDRFEIERHGSKMLKMLAEVDKMDKAFYPEPISRLVDLPHYKMAMKEIKAVINECAQRQGLVSEFIASKKQIHNVLKWLWLQGCDEEKRPDLLQGWRYTCTYETLEPVLAKLALI